MNPDSIKVVLVDDSATIRSALKIMIRREPDMTVVGAAPDGREGLRMANELKPDVILMDIEMPNMNGIQATRAIMRETPTPIIIFSSIAAESAPATLEALENGAVDFVTKDASGSALDIGNLKDTLLKKLRHFAAKHSGAPRPNVTQTMIRNRERREQYDRIKRESGRIPSVIAKTGDEGSTPLLKSDGSLVSARRKTMRLRRRELGAGPIRLVAIGSSTGGPQALNTLVKSIPASLSLPVVIVQHIPATFVPSFVERLDRAGHAHVEVATHGNELRSGHIYVSPGDKHLRIRSRMGQLVSELSATDVPNVLHKPSVDVLFDSVAETVRGEALAVVLTGMGRDGANGALQLTNLGATVVAQDEASSVVYGMPRAVAENGAATLILPIEEIGDAIVELVRKAPNSR